MSANAKMIETWARATLEDARRLMNLKGVNPSIISDLEELAADLEAIVEDAELYPTGDE